jgi:hypothetical protein
MMKSTCGHACTSSWEEAQGVVGLAALFERRPSSECHCPVILHGALLLLWPDFGTVLKIVYGKAVI